MTGAVVIVRHRPDDAGVVRQVPEGGNQIVAIRGRGAAGQPGMLAPAWRRPGTTGYAGVLSRPVVTDPRGSGVTGSLQGTAGGSLPAQARPAGPARMVQPVPQRLPAVPGHRRGALTGTRPDGDALGAWASVDHGHEHVRSIIGRRGPAFLLARCVPLLILVCHEVAQSRPPADDPLILQDAHRLGDCLPGMPM